MNGLMCHTAGMSNRGAGKWKLAVLAWTGLVFFCSTSMAGQWSESAFYFLCSLFLGVKPHHRAYGHLHFIAEKGVHVTLFFVFAILLWNATPTSPRKAAAILAAGLVVGSLAELFQFLFPGRDPAVRDVLIDLGGTAIGVMLSAVVTKRHAVTDELVPQ